VNLDFIEQLLAGGGLGERGLGNHLAGVTKWTGEGGVERKANRSKKALRNKSKMYE
jgi:hypothetical protein